MMEKMWKKWNPPILLVGMQIGAATWKAVSRLLKKLKIKLPYDPAIPLLIFRENENTNSKRHMHPNFHSSTVYNSKT